MRSPAQEALLRNRPLLRGRIALLGPSSAQLLPELPGGGLVMSEHAGVCASLAAHSGWQVCFGYDNAALAGGSFDSVVVFLPKARAELDMRLALARWLAAAGARLILVGEKKEGIAGAVKQLRAVVPQAAKVDSARHCQVWCADNLQSLPEFSVSQWLNWSRIECSGVAVDVAGLPGIFSQGELDEGTRMLLESFDKWPPAAGHRVLDFACGAGVVGAWLQAWQRRQGLPVATVDGLDVQSQAVVCAGATYRQNDASGDILASDGLAGVDGVWPVIVSNPPFHTGVKTDTSMTEQFLRDAARHLPRAGELRLVANRFLPYGSLMARCVGPVEKLLEDRRFTVYRAFRR